MKKANSVSGFLNILEEIGMENYIYRGQNNPYRSIQANGFRTYKGGWDSDKLYDLNYIHKEFKNSVVSKLSIDEKEHFLAYCQHYGIPTNLIDFSYSPLVALFFACEGKEDTKFSPKELINFKSWEELANDPNQQHLLIQNMINEAKKPYYSDCAQVYLLRKERIVDISDLISILNGKNLFEELLKKETIFSIFCQIINKHFAFIKDKKTTSKWLINLTKHFIDIVSRYHMDLAITICDLTVLEKAIENFENSSSQNETHRIRNLIQAINCIEDNDEESILKSISIQIDEFPNDWIAVSYLILLLKIIEILKTIPSKIELYMDLYFSYQPPNLFDRISNQQGLFIYQPYLYENDCTYNYHELIIQKIKPDVTIEIDNYEKVLSDLSLLGINNGSIYSDIDNIAKTVLKKSANKYCKDMGVEPFNFL